MSDCGGREYSKAMRLAVKGLDRWKSDGEKVEVR
jgi:hypothetical protein